ncbi:MAG: hypothetical protein WDZ76_10295 [Pseudohongiellaceae bacterium]
MKQESFVVPGWRAVTVAVVLFTVLTASLFTVIMPDIGLDPAVWLRSYVPALIFWLNIAMGSLLLLMIHELSGGGWGETILRPCRAAVATLPLLALLFVPLLTFSSLLYPWQDSVSPDTSNRSAYLGSINVAIRTVVIFTLWLVIAASMNVWQSSRRSRTLAPRAAAGLIVLVLTVTLFAIDWVLSLDPFSANTMIGFNVLAGQLTGALAFAIVVVIVTGQYKNAEERQGRLQDLGNLLLASVLFFAYILYMDYLIVWSGNLPDEIHWYLTRGGSTGLALITGLLFFHLFLPLVMLLSRHIKRSSTGLLIVALSVMLGRLLDTFWLLHPLYRIGGTPGLISDMVLMALLALVWIRVFTWLLRSDRSTEERGTPSQPGQKSL